MKFNDVITQRYSCRRYTDQPVSPELLTKIMSHGRISPSACNAQRWLFLAVDDKEKVTEISSAVVDNEFGTSAFAPGVPAYIAVVRHPMRRQGERQMAILDGGTAWADIDLGIATQSMVLSATNQGLGTCVIGVFNQQQVQAALDLPEELEVALLLAVGHPDQDQPSSYRRYDHEQIYGFNSYKNIQQDS